MKLESIIKGYTLVVHPRGLQVQVHRFLVLLSGHEGRDGLPGQGFESPRRRSGVVLRVGGDPVWENRSRLFKIFLRFLRPI